MKMKLVLSLIVICIVGIGISVYFAIKESQKSSSSSSSPTPTPTDFSVAIPGLYSFFLESYDTTSGESVYVCYQIIGEPDIDKSVSNNYKITLNMKYYKAIFDYPEPTVIYALPRIIPKDPPIGTVLPKWPPAPDSFSVEIDVDPKDHFPDNHLTVNIEGKDIVLLRYSLNAGLLTISYNKDLSNKFAIGNEFPTFDTSTITQQSVTHPDTDITSHMSLCTCSYKDIKYDVPGFISLTLTVALTLQPIYQDLIKLVKDYPIVLCSALIDSSVQEIVLVIYDSLGTISTGFEDIAFRITLTKKDDSDIITFGNDIDLVFYPYNTLVSAQEPYENKSRIKKSVVNTILNANHYSLKGCSSTTTPLFITGPVLKSDNSACDLCSTKTT